MSQSAAIVIGASAGALDALTAILPALPADFPAPILMVVHLPPDRPSLLAELLQSKCRLQVHEAEDKEPASPGTVYVAPPDYHLLAETDGTLSLSNEEPVNYSRPSIDVLFETAAEVYRERLVGMVLTGANSDGAVGLRKVLDRGGRGVIQSPHEAVASMMPQSAIALCPEATILRLDEIAVFLQTCLLFN